jgi:hypothetical protein
MVEMLYQISLTETIFDRSNGKNTLPGADYIGWNFTAMPGSAPGRAYTAMENHSYEGSIDQLYAHEIGFGGCRDFRLCLDETEGGRQLENSIRA